MNDTSRQPENMYPVTVIEQTFKGERAFDIFSRLHKDRIIFIGEQVGDAMANIICAQLFHLETEDNEAPITCYIQSPGGGVTAGLAMLSVMRSIKCPITTVCIGQAASMGSILLSGGGEFGQRFMAPYSTLMIHQVRGGTQGTVSAMAISVDEAKRLNFLTAEILAESCGKSVETLIRDMKEDLYMDPKAAIAYGLADAEIKSKKGPRVRPTP